MWATVSTFCLFKVRVTLLYLCFRSWMHGEKVCVWWWWGGSRVGADEEWEETGR